MSNNKQSSVEWLQSIELERDLTLADWNKAKAMHKEEQVNTFKHAQALMVMDSCKRAEQYYNETFGE